MKKIKLIIILLSVGFFSCSEPKIESDHLQIPGNWKFKIGDDVAFSQPSYDDSKWAYYKPDSILINQGFTYADAFGWYRKSVLIPSKLKKHTIYGDSLKIYLGKTGGNDQLFLNGHFIGENNRYVKEGTPVKSTFASEDSVGKVDKVYFIPFDDKRILWDKTNVISMRVFGNKYKTGNPYIAMKSLEDYIRYNKDAFYKSINNTIILDTVLQVKNTSDKIVVNGVIDITAKNKNKTVFHDQLKINLRPNVSTSIPVNLPFSMDKTVVYLQFEEDSSNLMAKDSILIPFILKSPE